MALGDDLNLVRSQYALKLRLMRTKRGSAPLLLFPDEILLMIAEYLPSAPDVWNLARSSKRLCSILAPTLNGRFPDALVSWAAKQVACAPAAGFSTWRRIWRMLARKRTKERSPYVGPNAYSIRCRELINKATWVLAMAMTTGRTDVMAKVLQVATISDLNCPCDCLGSSPLVLAVRIGNPAVMKLLLEREDLDPIAPVSA
jgi:hypothetical protein